MARPQKGDLKSAGQGSAESETKLLGPLIPAVELSLSKTKKAANLAAKTGPAWRAYSSLSCEDCIPGHRKERSQWVIIFNYSDSNL